MEIQLQELMEQIKKDGVEAAEKEADAIIKKANEDAEKIIADAKTKADALVFESKKEVKHMTDVGEEALKQAGRNILLSFRESVNKELKAILHENVTGVYSSSSFASLIVNAVENWCKNSDADDITLILSENDLKALENTVLLAMKEKMLSGVTLKAGNNLDSGFRISSNDGEAYYDYSAEAVVNMLSAYLSPKVVSLLKEAELK